MKLTIHDHIEQAVVNRESAEQIKEETTSADQCELTGKPR